MEFKGLNIVITGANSGIGLSILCLLSEKGNRILAADMNTDMLSSMDDPNVVPMVCDVSTAEGVDSIFEKAASVFGHIDVFFCNAGYAYYEKIEEPDWNHIDSIFRTNLMSVVYTYEMFVKHLNGRKGNLILTCSAMGKVAMPGFSIYSATKAAVDRFQEGVAFECPPNLTVTSSYPVSTDTGFFKRAFKFDMDKPFPVQTPDHVARRMVSAAEHGRRKVYPCMLFRLSYSLFMVLPPIRWMYTGFYRKKLDSQFVKYK